METLEIGFYILFRDAKRNQGLGISSMKLERRRRGWLQRFKDRYMVLKMRRERN